jgi:hypothetical protein
VQTAAKHRARILDKLKLSGDVELVHLAMQMRMPWTEAEAAEHSMPVLPALSVLHESHTA